MEYVDYQQGASLWTSSGGDGMNQVSAASSASLFTAVATPSADLIVRLVELAQLYFDDYGSQPNFDSLEACKVASSLPWMAPPMLAADSDGNVVATWEKGDACLTVKFARRHVLHYAMTCPSKDGSGVSRTWGESYIGFFFTDNRAAAEIARR